MKRYQELKLNFRIPDFLEDDIHAFIQYLNENPTGTLSDCYEAEIRSDINWCDGLTKEQAELLRNYYVRGGIFNGQDR